MMKDFQYLFWGELYPGINMWMSLVCVFFRIHF